MGSQPLSLGSWHTILVWLALELACEATALVFIAIWTERRWYERALIALPLAAFVWILWLARSIQTQLDYWTSYYAFLYAHYPPDSYPTLYAQTQQDYRAAIGGAMAGVNGLGWTAVLVMEGMVLLGGLLYWCAPGRPRRSPAKSPPPSAPAPLDGEAGELEITIEPLSRPYNA